MASATLELAVPPLDTGRSVLRVKDGVTSGPVTVRLLVLEEYVRLEVPARVPLARY